MKVTIRDEQVLRAIRPEELIAYLRSRGFREHGMLGGASSLWRCTKDGEEIEVLAPLAEHPGLLEREIEALRVRRHQQEVRPERTGR